MRKIPATKAAAPDATSELGHSTDFITVKEAAAILKLSEISIPRFLTQKKLRRFKVGARTLIRLSEAMSLIREAQ